MVFIQNIVALKLREKGSVITMLTLALLMATATGLLAQIKVYLPFSPIPITGQTFAVLLAGVLLGKNWGGISQIIYVILGMSGIGMFAGGYSSLISPSGGYIIGFIAAALFIGYVSDKYIKSGNFVSTVLLMSFANFIIIYGLGLLQLELWMTFITGSTISIKELMLIGAAPFVVGDMIKIIFATLIAKFVK